MRRRRYVHRKARMCMVLRLCPSKGGAPGEGTCRMRRMRRKHMSITGGTGSPAANSTPAHTYTFKHACVWHSRACSCAHMCMIPACMLLLASVPRGLEACRLFARDACTIYVCAQHAAHTHQPIVEIGVENWSRAGDGGPPLGASLPSLPRPRQSHCRPRGPRAPNRLPCRPGMPHCNQVQIQMNH